MMFEWALHPTIHDLKTEKWGSGGTWETWGRRQSEDGERKQSVWPQDTEVEERLCSPECGGGKNDSSPQSPGRGCLASFQTSSLQKSKKVSSITHFVIMFSWQPQETNTLSKTKTAILRHIIIKLFKVRKKEKFLKAQTERSNTESTQEQEFEWMLRFLLEAI